MEKPKIKYSLPRALAAEAFGTFLLTFVDAAISIMDFQKSGSIGVVGRSLGAVTAVGTMIFLIGEVSGAHINPAATLAFALRKVFPWKRVPLYLTVQFLGALCAGFILSLLFGGDLSHGLTEPQQSQGLCFVFEVLFTWFLVTSIVTTACASDVKGWEAAFPVGATLLFCGLVGKEITGASMNPARSLGTAVFGGGWDSIWIYIAAPLVGSLLGVLTTFVIRGRPTSDELKAAQGS